MRRDVMVSLMVRGTDVVGIVLTSIVPAQQYTYTREEAY